MKVIVIESRTCLLEICLNEVIERMKILQGTESRSESDNGVEKSPLSLEVNCLKIYTQIRVTSVVVGGFCRRETERQEPLYEFTRRDRMISTQMIF